MPDGARNLFAVNPDGEGQVQITRDLIIEGSWSWSPNRRLIAAQVGEKGQSEVALITLGPDGKASSVVSLTADVNADAAFPAWAPDGTRIAFQHKGEGGFQVFVMDADGANKRKISGGTGFAGLPAWSPNGKQVLFLAGDKPDIGTPKEIYIMDIDGAAGSARKITSFGKDISRPTWSPDGQKIAYIERIGDRAGSVMLVGVDGQNARKVGDAVSNASPQFSPDGGSILYYNVAPPEGSDIFIGPVGEGVPTNLTPGPGEDYVPTWSPDGKRLAWAGIVPGVQGHKIVVANADGTGAKVVSTGEGDDYQPMWAPAAEQASDTPSR
jgi:Tol biopolymer transport system component